MPAQVHEHLLLLALQLTNGTGLALALLEAAQRHGSIAVWVSPVPLAAVATPQLLYWGQWAAGGHALLQAGLNGPI